MQEINALGKTCPMPVILTKKALKKYPNEALKISVDNKIATQNLKKMAEQLQLSYQMEKINEGYYEVTLNEEGSEKKLQPKTSTQIHSGKEDASYIVVIHSDKIGQGPEELGALLMKSFVFSLSEQEQLPSKILFYNSGANLTVEGSPVLEDLQAMAVEGVEILTCGICLEYFEYQDKLAVGDVTNMYQIVELQKNYKIVSP
ncbi:sulfurtransferase-like selenium metabolism protein YedF [Jeotgalibaca sp. MA1X17-3]|uniref:sulfurtransferase-like selenium metabolism protein YedF n=1 Tax=Jeotgalibaca sp. MA1X17-3 TaxID=2908211 RepID=UPI001F37F339|nr:sulfurtransferase-like selenium metabolism protein YedF [Jeotgalibaca sp. MA1X17-3]UJF16386.1 sulfurtransferase-like selenium metabolism protein YedF [Jeotgalibaca sp. MA1X17-3]